MDRHRDSFRDLVENHVDILFANEAEIISLYQASSLKRRPSRCVSTAAWLPHPQ